MLYMHIMMIKISTVELC